MKKKKDSNIGIFILFLVLVGTVGFIIYYDKVINITKTNGTAELITVV